MKTRLLIIANTAMNEFSSNGRTLMNLLSGFEAEELAQFYINGTPDFTCCRHYYHISDNTALKSVIKPSFRKIIHGKVNPCDTYEKVKSTSQQTKKIAKSCKNKYIRSLIWSTQRWWTSDFEIFLDDFSPQAVLLYAGDAPFMYDIARLIAKKRRIPLYMYNCENYVLKEVLYASAKKNSIWHFLLKHRLKKSYSNFMKKVDYCFYITEYLEKQYQLTYHHSGKSNAIYTASNMYDYSSEHKEPEQFTLLYCGNFGVGRPAALLSLAKVLYEVDPTAKLKLFGTFPDNASEEQLLSCPNVEFGGRIPYAQVLEETKNCSLLIHCENPERVKNLQCAFSTKLADYLACGIPILIYALREYPFVQYFDEHNAAHIASDEEELKKILTECTEDKAFKEKYVKNALALANKNHSLQKNGEFVRSIICSEKI